MSLHALLYSAQLVCTNANVLRVTTTVWSAIKECHANLRYRRIYCTCAQ